MFTRHFNLNDHPFMEQPPGKRLLRNAIVEEGLARLKHFADCGRIALLTGPTGVGKTSLLRQFADDIREESTTTIRITASRMGANALLRQVVHELGEAPGRGRDRLYAQLDAKTRLCGTSVLLVIDDAHLIEPVALTDLRLLSDTTLEQGTPCFRILLSGQEELLRVLRQDRFADVRDRVNVRVQISPLSDPQQTSIYIGKQLSSAGGNPKIFTDEAVHRIHNHCGGVLRRINNAATACLLLAATCNAKVVDEPLCLRAFREVL